jgi:hypothetical protein
VRWHLQVLHLVPLRFRPVSYSLAAAPVLALASVVIGAGLRVPPAHLMLFEKLINLVHAGAPGARICFNTKPTDTVEAVQRWL